MRYLPLGEIVYLYIEAKNYLVIMLNSNAYTNEDIAQQCKLVVHLYNLKNE